MSVYILSVAQHTHGIYAVFVIGRVPSTLNLLFSGSVVSHICTSVISKWRRVAKSGVGAYGTADAVRGGLATWLGLKLGLGSGLGEALG